VAHREYLGDVVRTVSAGDARNSFKMNNEYKSRGLVVLGWRPLITSAGAIDFVKDFIASKGSITKLSGDDGTMAARWCNWSRAQSVIPQSFCHLA